MELFIVFISLVALLVTYDYCKEYQIPQLGWFVGVLGITSIGLLSIALIGLAQGL
jgi:hypothetical protein